MSEAMPQSTGSSEGGGPAVRPEPPPPWPAMVLVPVGMIAGAIAVWALARGAAWPVLTAMVITGVLVGIADLGLRRVQNRIAGRMRVAQIAAVIVAAVLVGAYFRMDRDSAFQQIFGTTPPMGVSSIDIERTQTTETHRDLLVLSFEASQQQMDALLQKRGFQLNPAFQLKPGKEKKEQRSLWSSAFVAYGTGIQDRWKTRLPTLEPHVYNWVGTDRQTIGQQATVLYDGLSGRAYAVAITR